jgi:hypothetical protein
VLSKSSAVAFTRWRYLKDVGGAARYPHPDWSTVIHIEQHFEIRRFDESRKLITNYYG